MEEITDNFIDLKEEKKENITFTHLKLNGVNINRIKSYEIKKEKLDELELTLNISINPNKSSIQL